jgi:hypothetical protein
MIEQGIKGKRIPREAVNIIKNCKERTFFVEL